MYNPHTCSVPTFYNTDFAQYQCLGQTLQNKTADGRFLSTENPSRNQSGKETELELCQTEFAFGMEFAKNSNLNPNSKPQIQPKINQIPVVLNNIAQPMHRLPWGEEALGF